LERTGSGQPQSQFLSCGSIHRGGEVTELSTNKQHFFFERIF
jgi:hypothetical protein